MKWITKTNLRTAVCRVDKNACPLKHRYGIRYQGERGKMELRGRMNIVWPIFNGLKQSLHVEFGTRDRFVPLHLAAACTGSMVYYQIPQLAIVFVSTPGRIQIDKSN